MDWYSKSFEIMASKLREELQEEQYGIELP